MCIIAYKPAGANFPTKKQFKTMFKHNPDGAGFMTTNDTGVVISKGFMCYSDFKQALAASKPDQSKPYIFHFRIATHGGINPEMTQPFPMTAKASALKSLRTVAEIGVAHNGIIPLTYDARKMSDTAEFIRDYMMRLYDRSRGFDDITLNIIEACIDSKMAILEKNGAVHILGRGWKKCGDLYFSNDSYLDYSGKPAKKQSRKAYSWSFDDWSAYNPTDYYESFCDGYCDACLYQKQCWDTVASTDAGLNTI